MVSDEIRVARIDVVVTIPGKGDWQWLDATMRRPTAVSNVEGAGRFGGSSAIQRERENEKNVGRGTRSAPTG